HHAALFFARNHPRSRHDIEGSAGPKFLGDTNYRGREDCMKIRTITAIIALPLLALGQTTEPQQSQEPTKETQTTAPSKGKKMRSAQAEPNTGEAQPDTG